ncbi:MAG TPA: hypothetical protein VEX38_09640 [Fimbriimonadaceae bacterium]|nr:hypothetical protein [Fimbriimonadaceae bacterium]
MERKTIIAEAAKAGILPGLVFGGVLALLVAILPRDPNSFARVLWMFPVGAVLGGAIGAIVSGLIADHRNPP